MGKEYLAKKKYVDDEVNTNVAYSTCTTEAATAEKSVSIVNNPNWKLQPGSIIVVKFSHTNTAQNPKLKVGTYDAKPILYGTATITTANLDYGGYANAYIEYIYNGTHFIFVGWSFDSNSIYTNATLGQGYGTCTTSEATIAKKVTWNDYELSTGGIVAIKFTNAVPAGSTLNINSKGDKAIYYKGTAITDGIIKAGNTATFIYNGQYHLIAIDGQLSWNDITDKPGTFPPSYHSHGISDINDLSGALDEKLSVASREYIPIRSITESVNFNTDFQLTDDDPNKVVFINIRAMGNTNIPTGIPMPYMLTVERLYSNGNYYVLRQSFTGLSDYASENAKVIEYERLYVCVTTKPFWTSWKKCDTAVLDTKFDTAGSGLTADGTTIKHTDDYTGNGFGDYLQKKYIKWGDTISVPWGSANNTGHLTNSGTTDVVLPVPSWNDITDKPSGFPPESHSHSWSSITGKPGTFPPSYHSHGISDINDLDGALDEKLSIASRNYVPIRYVSESMNFDTDFQLTSADPNKVIFTNTKSVLNNNSPTGIPMPYMLTVERLYSNGSVNYFRQTFTGLMNAGSESAYIVEYQRLYICTASPFWTEWKAVASGGEDDHKVIQEYVAGADYEYPILCSTDTEHTQSTTTDKTLKILRTTINPKAGTITTNKFIGTLEGRASSADSVEWENVQDKPESYPPETHSHNYAASTYAGGPALSANKLNTNAGSGAKPVYFVDGVPTECTYELNKTVPADAVFTDNNVNQEATISNGEYRLLLSNISSDISETAAVKKCSKFKANPSTGELSATKFNGQIAWDNVTGKPSSFTPSGHSHAMSDISNLNSTINSLTSTLNSINTALELHKVAKPFTKSSDQSDLIVRGESYVQYNDYLWKFNLFFTNAKNIPANTETVIATTSYPPKYDVVKTAVTIWKNDNSAAHTNNAIVKIKSNGDITITTPTAISGTGVNYARINEEVFTAVNF